MTLQPDATGRAWDYLNGGYSKTSVDGSPRRLRRYRYGPPILTKPLCGTSFSPIAYWPPRKWRSWMHSATSACGVRAIPTAMFIAPGVSAGVVTADDIVRRNMTGPDGQGFVLTRGGGALRPGEPGLFPADECADPAASARPRRCRWPILTTRRRRRPRTLSHQGTRDLPRRFQMARRPARAVAGSTGGKTSRSNEHRCRETLSPEDVGSLGSALSS